MKRWAKSWHTPRRSMMTSEIGVETCVASLSKTKARWKRSPKSESQSMTEIPGPRSRALHERRAAVVARGVSLGSPVYAARAHGGIIEDVDGNRFIDLTSGIGVVTVGHTDEAVVAASRE